MSSYYQYKAIMNQMSIIIPTWNRKENLYKTLTCLKRNVDTMERGQVEIIVVDDCSTDGTDEMLKEFVNIKVIKTENRVSWNASIPRNIGAKASSKGSQLLIFLDSDVSLPPDRIQRYYDLFFREADVNNVIIGPYNFLREPVDVTNENWYKEESIKNYDGDIRFQSFVDHPVEEKNRGLGFALACFGGNIGIPRKLFFKAGGYDEAVTSGCEDGDFGLTLWETGATFTLDMGLLGWHQPHPIANSRTKDISQMVKYIDEKHNMDLIKTTGEVYRTWGIDWKVPEVWLKESEETAEANT